LARAIAALVAAGRLLERRSHVSFTVRRSAFAQGAAVYDPQGNHLGSIKRLMIEKINGKVAYGVMPFGGFLGMGEDEHTIPWSKLNYDTSLGGYRTDITEEQLRGAPTFYRDRDYD
jgi:hypothetical protein